MKTIKTLTLSLLLAAMLGCFSLCAYADNDAVNTQTATTTIRTYIPETVEMKLQFAAEGGAIVVDGVSFCTDAQTMAAPEDTDAYLELVEIPGHTVGIQLPVGVEQTYYFVPAEGMKLVKLVYNGEDVTDQVIDNSFTAPTLSQEGSLIASFASEDEGLALDSGDSPVASWIVTNLRAIRARKEY